ncbi:sigma-70 family RNA polymerase sigma factor [Proteiniclasticum sp.]|uniref:sigma-70 family RNA polymerase sigma factor n=1 Tax=Proteiniclasticum sp. TaxID=2053595 RepID=UPI0028A223DA|nr:sigma-70 family RNA polymerase sigma factor [Proteiniclasticum sp.]
MNKEIIIKMVKPLVKNNQLTYDQFHEIFSMLSRKEQYDVTNILEENQIELVDYYTICNSDFDNKEIRSTLYGENDHFNERKANDNELLTYDIDESVFKDETKPREENTPQLLYKNIKQSNEVLCRLIQQGSQQAKQDICVKNEGLVRTCAIKYEKYYSSDLDLEDLIQVGYLGLIKAAERFDHSMENSFSTYAVYWIRQSISREIMDTGALIRVPVHKHELINKITRINNELIMENLSLNDRITRIAEMLDRSEDTIKEAFVIKNNYLKVASLNVLVGEDDSSELGEFIPDEESISVEEIVEYKALIETINESLDSITPREKDVIALRFGLEDGKLYTLEEIGKTYKVTRERIRQIEAKALKKLRHPSRSKKLKDYLSV